MNIGKNKDRVNNKNEKGVFMLQRPRRLRENAILRNTVRETILHPGKLIYPIFIVEGERIEREISSMPGQYHYSIDRAIQRIARLKEEGVTSFLLFGIPKSKDAYGSQAYDNNGIIQRAIQEIKKIHRDILIITDVCMCEYTSHGHCGIVKMRSGIEGEYYIDNDASLLYLSKIAVSYARAGADIIAPSDMMDGRVYAIRRALDRAGFTHIPIMSYSVKYASSFYGPFREAASCAPVFGNRKTYQMDIYNRLEAIREVEQDIVEGVDMIIVKPALAYLDIIREVKDRVSIPVIAYSVSGEYAMLKAGAKAGFLVEEEVMMEMAVSTFRAGADIYITYYAEEIAKVLRKND